MQQKNRFISRLSIFKACVRRVSAAKKKKISPCAVPPGLKLMLPETIYTVPGVECSVYFENVIDSANPEAYAIEVKCERGTHGERRWFWTPEEKDAGCSFDFELRLLNDYGMILSGKCKVSVAKEPADLKKKITFALLSDSGVNCDFPHQILKDMRECGLENYTPVGSHSGFGEPAAPDRALHDGYGGFAWRSFLSRWAYSEEEISNVQDEAERQQMISLGVAGNVPANRTYRLRSPLLRIENGKKIVDIPGWLQKINDGQAPDILLISLGGNDMFKATSDELEEWLSNIMQEAKTLLIELRKYMPETLIGISTQPLGCSQDGFGENYKCRQSRYQYRRNIQRYNRELPKLIREMNDPRMELVSVHHIIDPLYGYMQEERRVNARCEKTDIVYINALHQSKEGGYQWGDAIYFWLRKKLEK